LPSAETIAVGDVSPTHSDVETISALFGADGDSFDGCAGPIFSGPRRPIGGVRVKLSRCSNLTGDARFNEKNASSIWHTK